MLASAPAASTSDTAPTARRRVRPGVHRAAELLEHDRGVDHAPAGAAVRLGHEQADDAEVGQARATPRRRARRRRRRTRRARTARSAPGRRGSGAPSRAASPGRGENSKSIARDGNVRLRPPMRLQYAPEEEAFRAELVAWLEANAPGDETLARAEAVERAHARLGAGVAAHALRRRLARPGLAAGARWPQRDADAADDLLRGDERARDPAQREPAGARHHRPVDHATTARRSSRSSSSSRRCGPRSHGASA